ncbi:MAG: DUF192 domain-containing protein [Candidatus Woesearchaeota archaeon]
MNLDMLRRLKDRMKHKHHDVEEFHRKRKNKLHYGTLVRVGIGVVALLAVLIIFANTQAPDTFVEGPQVCFKGNVCQKLMIVKTDEAMRIGLSNYTLLPQDTVMLFIFKKAEVHSIWMKDMDFSIDILWIGKNQRIQHIEKYAVPCHVELCEIFSPEVNAKYVLETNAGFADKWNLYNTDSVEFRNIDSGELD